MGSERVAAACRDTGIPFAADAWPKESEMPLPCLVYSFEGTNDLYADGVKYLSIEGYTVTLYSARRDEDAERKVARAFAAQGITLGDAASERDPENGWRWTLWPFEVIA